MVAHALLQTNSGDQCGNGSNFGVIDDLSTQRGDNMSRFIKRLMQKDDCIKYRYCKSVACASYFCKAQSDMCVTTGQSYFSHQYMIVISCPDTCGTLVRGGVTISLKFKSSIV